MIEQRPSSRARARRASAAVHPVHGGRGPCPAAPARRARLHTGLGQPAASHHAAVVGELSTPDRARRVRAGRRRLRALSDPHHLRAARRAAEDWKLFSSWATDIFRIFNDKLAEDLPLIERAHRATAYVSDLIAERRADPADDLLSDLIAIEEEGDRLSTDEMAMLAQAVLMAGTDTTRNQLACSRGALHRTPRPVGAPGRAARAGAAGGRGVHALPRSGAGHRPLRLRGHRLPRRPLPPGDLGVTSLAGPTATLRP